MSAYTPVAPEMSLDKRMENLRLANQTRFYRSAVKQKLAAQEASAAQYLRVPVEPMLHTMRVADLLGAQFKWGPARVRKVMRRVVIADSKTVGGLSDRQREDLIREVGW